MVLKINKKLAVITALWVCVIFAFTLQPGDISGNLSDGLLGQILKLFCPQLIESLSESEFEILHTVLRKCAHFAEFFVLGVLSFVTLSKNSMKMRLWISTGFCAVIASMDETIQLFVPERAGRIWDVLLDCTGAITGIAISCLLAALIKHRKELKQ